LITPNKVITLRESALGKTPMILRAKGAQVNLASLYRMVGKEFESIDQFLLTLDVLYVLGRIDIDFATGMVTYAD
jgi:hypothetical protein